MLAAGEGRHGVRSGVCYPLLTHQGSQASAARGQSRRVECLEAERLGGPFGAIGHSLLSANRQVYSSLGCFAECVARAEQARSARAGLTARRNRPESAGEPRPRVLVVDDEESITDLVGTALRYEGFQVEVARGGRDALAAATSFRPHLIVLDVMLPDMDGFEVQRRLAAD